MGIWVGLSPDVRHGHLIVPIRWNAAEQFWELLATVTAVIVRVFDNVLPLRRVPIDGVYGSQEFDTCGSAGLKSHSVSHFSVLS